LRGFNKPTKKVLETALTEAVPLWIERPALEHRRVPVPTGEGSYQLVVEPYQGVHSWINFKKQFEMHHSVRSLEERLSKDAPDLLQSVNVTGASWMAVQGDFAIICCLAERAKVLIESGLSQNSAISATICELEEIYKKRAVEIEVMSMIGRFSLPPGCTEIDFGDAVIRKISPEHIVRFASNDITDVPRYDIIQEHVTCALFISQKAAVSLGTYPYDWPTKHQEDLAWHEQIQSIQSNVFEAFFLLKPGHLHVVATHYTHKPFSLPGVGGSSSISRGAPFVGFYQVELDEIDELKRLYQAVKSCKLGQLKVAISRLVFCEGRASATDALIDAMIGLEALLNPMDNREMSFRVALNYAYLFPAGQRREKYDDMSRVQACRNKIVHGGTKKTNAKWEQELSDVLQIAKAALRFSIRKFLFELVIDGKAKLDTGFWLDRIIPQHPSPAPQNEGEV
jgi:Apea-like HEPN